MKSVVVIPAYRAEKTLPSVLERLPTAFWQEGMVVIVNDCSPDGTGAVAEGLRSRFQAVEVVHHRENRGYGGAQKTGLQHGMRAGANAFAIVHADGQYAPERVLELLQPILKGQADIVQGSRMLAGGARRGGMPISRYVANRVLTAMENVVFGTRMAEFHSGYMLYSRRLLERAPFERLQNNFNFDAEMIVLAHLLGHKCAQIAIPTRYDDTTSSLAPIPYGINVLKMMGRHLCGHYRGLLAEHAAGKPAGNAH